MPIERRFKVVKLYQGSYEQRLADKLEEMSKAETAERQGVRRMAQKSDADRLAKEYDALRAEADESAVQVKVYALGFRDFGRLSDLHEPRDGEAVDKKYEANMKTFPDALAEASVADPDVSYSSIEARQQAGRIVVDNLGEISRVHWVKIRNAAWDVNVTSDELPKFSAVSLLQESREATSRPPSDSESGTLDD